MKWFFILYTALGILLVSIIMIGMYSSTVGHEQAHVQINKYFGMDSTYVVNFNFDGISGLTTPDVNDTFYSPEDRRAAYMIHGINEAIGYQLKPLLNIIIGFLAVIIMLLAVILFGGIYNGETNDRRKTTTMQNDNCRELEQPMP